jgi:hypothetical protein
MAPDEASKTRARITFMQHMAFKHLMNGRNTNSMAGESRSAAEHQWLVRHAELQRGPRRLTPLARATRR